MSAKQQVDPSPTSYREILQIEIEEGLHHLNRPAGGLLLSGLSAGLDIGFGPFLMAVFLTFSGDALSGPLVRILVANAYAVGFIIVVLGRSELFTEHTTLAILPVFDRQASVIELGRLWGFVYVSNLVGGGLFAGFAVYLARQIDTVDPAAYGALAGELVGYSAPATLAAGVMAGWLMGLMTWLVAAGRNSISQVVFVWMIAFTIGVSHLPHSIAGSVEVLLGLFAGQGVTPAEFLEFLVWSTVGNLVGGTVFVALLKYGHGVEGGAAPDAYSDTARTAEDQDRDQNDDPDG